MWRVFDHRFGGRYLWGYKGRIGALILSLLLGLNWGWQTYRDRELDLRQAATMVTGLSRAAEYQVDGSIRSIAALLDEAADRLDPEHWPDRELEEWFSARLMGFPEIRILVLANAKGDIIGYISRPGQGGPVQAENIADREYFLELSKHFPAKIFHISAPVSSRLTGAPIIPIVRSISRPDGGFGGVVVASTNPDTFHDKLESVLVEDEGSAGLIRSDGLFLARSPRHDESVGKSIISSPLFQDYLSKGPNGVADLVATMDGNDKLLAYRTLVNYPLVVTVGITKKTALARWHTQMQEEGLVLALVVAGLIGLAWLYDLRSQSSRVLNNELQAQRDMLEQQVEERTAHLAATNAELEQFAYIASHDLQEPLRTITGFLQLLSRRYQGRLDGEADEFIGFAVGGAKRMSLLINDLLAFSRVGRTEEPAEPCDCKALAQGALAGLAQAMADCGAQVTIDDLPAALCRPIQVQSVFQNLIGNAIKYRTPDRVPEIRVFAQTVDEDGAVCFAIKDNGIGIDPEYHDRIFGIFQRLHPREKYEGTGIGLALCRKIVERHGGRIWVESALGQGTTIYFTLPAA